MMSTRPADSQLYDDDDDDDDDDDEALVPEPERIRRAQMQADVVSPFAAGGSANGASLVHLELTLEAVDRALDEVRPMLIADGGNIDVIEVDAVSGVVKVSLVGACNTCPSASVTMQQGVETTLMRLFPAITSVVNVDAPSADSDAPSDLTAEMVETTVGQILPAINGMGGKLRVVSVTAAGVVTLEFTGPARVQYGVDLALRDNKLVKKVVFISPS
jgi:Fe-S cluster biogenesis protein NfuA